jgi:poly(A) polymerase
MAASPCLKEFFGLVLKLSRQKNKKIYIVGGYLRDVFLGKARDSLDIDFCLKHGSLNFGRRLSKISKAGFVVLDKERGCCRLLKRLKARNYTFDFSDFRAVSLEEDLRQRDFSINSLAVRLEDIAQEPLEPFIIDHCGGLQDLRKGLIRIPSSAVLRQDALRVLRAFSFVYLLGFRIEPKTLQAIRKERVRLEEVSPERIRDELFKVLRLNCASEYLRQLDRYKILKVIMPELEVMHGVRQGPYHHLDVWQHSLECCRQFEALVDELKRDEDIRHYLAQEVSSGRSRYALLKLGALLHDLGKPDCRVRKAGRIKFYGHEKRGFQIAGEIIKRLRFSNDEFESLRKIILWHLRPGYLADTSQISSRAKFRFFRDTGKEAVAVLLLAVADQRATRGRLSPRKKRLRHEDIAFNLIREYFRRQKEVKPQRLLNGHQLMRKFKLTSSPLVGRILRELEELQAIGKIRNKQEALRAAKRFLD